MPRRALFYMVLGLIFFWPFSTAGAQTARDALNDFLAQARDVLRASVPDSHTNAGIQPLADLSDSMFDWEEMARRSVGGKWRTLSEDRRRDLVAACATEMQREITGRISSLARHSISLDRERRLNDVKSEVAATLHWGPAEVPVHFRLHQRKGRWQVYDVLMLGSSLVEHFKEFFSGRAD